MSDRNDGRRSLRAAFAVAGLVAGALAAQRLSAAEPAPPLPFARDEGFTVRFDRRASLWHVQAAIWVHPAADSGASDVRGRWILGRPLLDPSTGRGVVVRPEALREYFLLTDPGVTRDEADAERERILARVERTGDLAPLDEIDDGLRSLLGPSAGTRLDDPAVTAFYPPSSEGASEGLRLLIAGDDVLWRKYVDDKNLPWIDDLAALKADPRFERFYHPIDPATGVASSSSVLRQREHRRVLYRRTRLAATFVPDIPMRADLSDAGYSAGGEYDVSVGRQLLGTIRSITTARGERMPLSRLGASFATAPDVGDGEEFLGGASSAPATPSDALRVVNVTPPSGETDIDMGVDWEDPEEYEWWEPREGRNPFVFRVRFSRPLDPRTVDPAHFLVTLIDTGVPNPALPPAAVAVRTFLVQLRDGEVVVEVEPYSLLYPAGHFELRVLGTVRALDGTPLGEDFVRSAY